MSKRRRNRDKKKKKAFRPFCYYCDREFDDLRILIEHQKAKHFKCPHCPRRLVSVSGMITHVTTVHKMQVTGVPNAKDDRNHLDFDVVGMEGIPLEFLEEKYDGEIPEEIEYLLPPNHPLISKRQRQDEHAQQQQPRQHAGQPMQYQYHQPGVLPLPTMPSVPPFGAGPMPPMPPAGMPPHPPPGMPPFPPPGMPPMPPPPYMPMPGQYGMPPFGAPPIPPFPGAPPPGMPFPPPAPTMQHQQPQQQQLQEQQKGEPQQQKPASPTADSQAAQQGASPQQQQSAPPAPATQTAHQLPESDVNDSTSAPDASAATTASTKADAATTALAPAETSTSNAVADHDEHQQEKTSPSTPSVSSSSTPAAEGPGIVMVYPDQELSMEERRSGLSKYKTAQEKAKDAHGESEAGEPSKSGNNASNFVPDPATTVASTAASPDPVTH